jgi:feruloyl-CoA synthase
MTGADVPYRATSFPSSAMKLERRPDGVIILEPVEPLQPYVANIPRGLALRAALSPEKTYLAERPAPDADWVRQSYGETKRRADAFAQWLLDQRIGRDRTVLILSGNSLLHAVVKYGAMAARVPVCPVSVNYALMGGDYGRLRHVVGMVRPAVVFAEQAALFARALDAVDFGDARLVTDAPGRLERQAVAIREVLDTPVTGAVAASIDSIDPDEASVYMLTSGSTSMPKAVIQTQRMISSNLAQGIQVLNETAGWKDTMLDWLPWNHVSGAFTMMGVALTGGTLYIDAGKPLPGLFEQSIRNYKEIAVQYFTNVPAGYAMLADALERDDELRRTFFSRMTLMLYGGAGLPQALYDRLQRLAVRTVGRRIFFTTGYGATETASGCMAIYFHSEQVGIGLPMPGLSVKLVPRGDRYELRMKGPMVTPGYLNMPEKSAAMFDDEGYFMIGDTARFHDPNDVQKGLAFAGRLAEEFKLATGTWVHGGLLRAQIVQAAGGLIADALICGEGRDYLAVLAWPALAPCRRVIGEHAERMEPSEVVRHAAVRSAIVTALKSHNEAHAGSSSRVARCAFLLEPPCANAHEISDKGTINQNVALRRREADVERLYSTTVDPEIIVLEGSS